MKGEKINMETKQVKLFKEKEKEKAEAILKQLEGLSISSAQFFLERCISALVETTVDINRLNL